MSTTTALQFLRHPNRGSRRFLIKSKSPRVELLPRQDHTIQTAPGQDSRMVEGVEEETIGDEECCVLCVGSTGTGKSFSISVMTGLPLNSNAGAESVTKRCALYRPLSKMEGRVPVKLSYIDTVGWDDTSCDDEETFRDILRFIDANYLTSIKAILWHVLPNVRRDALLSRQARLIDQFAEHGQIWDNVIIICKQAMNPEDDSKGPMRVALEYSPDAEVQLVGYRSVDDPTLSEKQRKAFQEEEVRAAFNVLTRDDIRSLLSDRISHIKRPFKVVFKNSYCLDCAEIGDVRLMSAFCHMEPHLAHSGRLRYTHPKGTEYFHPNPVTVNIHEGTLRHSPFKSIMDYVLRRGSSATQGKRYTCCGQRSGQPGCVRRWACCRQVCKPSQQPDQMGCRQRFACCKMDTCSESQGCEQRYSCCEKLYDEPGCQKMCKKCDRPWGSEPRGCYKKQHNVRRLSTYGREIDALIDAGDHLPVSSLGDNVSNEANDHNSSNTGRLFEPPPAIIYHLF